MKVLLVSGSARARVWMRGALGPAWEVREAAEGIEAVRAARDERFDLVVADETTGPYGAFGLARELKILAEPPAVVVLLDRAQDAWLARWSGADRWLTHPVGPFELAAAARELAGKPALRLAETDTARDT